MGWSSIGPWSIVRAVELGMPSVKSWSLVSCMNSKQVRQSSATPTRYQVNGAVEPVLASRVVATRG
jgi:hypothetical protein